MRRNSGNAGLWLGLLAFAGVVVPACFYPDYSFNEAEPTGAGGDTASGTTTASTMTTGGAGGVGGTGSTGGAGGTGGNGTTSSATGGGGTGGDIGPEDCLNGTDDNGDGDIDCADALCGDFSCVSAVPATWTGHFVLFDGPPGMDPDCPESFPGTTNGFLGNGSLVAPAALCSACTCGGPTGQTCNTPTEVMVLDAALNVNCGEAVPNSINCGGALTLGPPNGTCFIDFILPGVSTCGPGSGMMCDMGSSPCNAATLADAPTVTGGTCAVGGGVATVPNASWMNLGRGCGDPAAAGQGCNGTQVCLPKPDAPYESGVCISKLGDNACPPGAFAEKHLFYQEFTDTRGCTGCSCGNPSGSTCAATVQLYSDNLCNNETASFVAGGCDNLTGNPDVRGRRLTTTQPPTGGSCAAAGGQPTGGTTPTMATTFCCIP